MTLTALSTNESLVIGTPYDAPKSGQAKILHYQVNAAKGLPVLNSTPIDDFIKEFSDDVEMVDALANARKGLSEVLYGTDAPTFSAIRLSAGLSQDQLAEMAMTSQSHIAKIEAGKNDPGTDVIAKLARALSKDETEVFTAIRNQRKLNEANERE